MKQPISMKFPQKYFYDTASEHGEIFFLISDKEWVSVFVSVLLTIFVTKYSEPFWVYTLVTFPVSFRHSAIPQRLFIPLIYSSENLFLTLFGLECA